MSREPREMKIFSVSVDDQPAPYPFQLRFTRAAPDGPQEYPSDGHDNSRKDDSEVYDFHAIGDPGSGGIFAGTALVKWDQQGRQQIDPNQLMGFFDRILPDDEAALLKELIARKDISIPLQVLVNIYEWLLEEYSGRPTRQSLRSSGGGHSTGQRSTGPSLTRVAT